MFNNTQTKETDTPVVLNASEFTTYIANHHSNLVAAEQKNREKFTELYQELCLNLIKQVVKRLLEDLLHEWQRQVKAESWNFPYIFPSERKRLLNEDITNFKLQLEGLKGEHWKFKYFIKFYHSADSADKDNRVLNNVKAQFHTSAEQCEGVGAVATWLLELLSGGGASNSPQMNAANLNALQGLSPEWARPLALAMESAARNLTTHAQFVCQQSENAAFLHNECVTNITKYSEATVVAQQALKQSYFQIAYPQLSDSKSSEKPVTETKSAKKSVAKTKSTLFNKRADLEPRVLYVAIAEYLGEPLDENNKSTIDKAKILTLVNAHAKNKSWFSFDPGQKTTLIRLIESAEKAQLSDQDWLAVQRRLKRLNNYLSRNTQASGAYTGVSTNENAVANLTTWFDGVRYGRPENIFEEANIKQTLDLISGPQEVKDFIEQLKTNYKLDREDNNLESLSRAANKKDNESAVNYIVPQDPSKLMRELYFILLKHDRGNTQAEGVFDVDSGTGEISFVSNDDNELDALLINSLPQFRFSLLLLVKTLTFIRVNQPEQYNNLRQQLLDCLRASPLSFASFQFSSENLWLKKYLPIEEMEEVADNLGKIIALLEIKILPAQKKDERLSPQKLAKINIEKLQKIADFIAPSKNGVKVTDLRKIEEMARDLQKTQNSLKIRAPFTIEEQEIYLLCSYYKAQRCDLKNTTQKTMSDYCGSVILAIETGSCIPVPVTPMSLSKVGSVKRLLEYINPLIVKVNGGVVQRTNSFNTENSVLSSNISAGSTTPSKNSEHSGRNTAALSPSPVTTVADDCSSVAASPQVGFNLNRALENEFMEARNVGAGSPSVSQFGPGSSALHAASPKKQGNTLADFRRSGYGQQPSFSST